MPFKSETNPHAKLTLEKVNSIKAAINKGIPAVTIAKDFNISTSTISRIKRNKIWKEEWVMGCKKGKGGKRK